MSESTSTSTKMVHRRSDLSPFIPHGPMIYSVPEETIPLGDSLHDLMTFGKSTGIPMVLSFYPQLMVSFVIIFTQLKKIHSGSTKSLSKTYQIEYPLYIPFIPPRSSSYFCVTIHSPYSLFKKEQGNRNPDHSSVLDRISRLHPHRLSL